MGATTSKQVVRKFPQTAKPEILASKPSASPSSVAPLEQHASETKTDFIEEDGKDPQLERKLAELGPVTVPNVTTKFRKSDTMTRILQNRQHLQSSRNINSPLFPTSQASTTRATSTDRLTALDLHDLLQHHKEHNDAAGGATSASLIAALSKQYGLQEDTTRALVERLNTYATAGTSHNRTQSVWVSDREGVARLRAEEEERRKMAAKEDGREKKGVEERA